MLNIDAQEHSFKLLTTIFDILWYLKKFPSIYQMLYQMLFLFETCLMKNFNVCANYGDGEVIGS